MMYYYRAPVNSRASELHSRDGARRCEEFFCPDPCDAREQLAHDGAHHAYIDGADVIQQLE
jgi:hypothetical protein